eukprot:396207-Prymnesium_polylepis.3
MPGYVAPAARPARVGLCPHESRAAHSLGTCSFARVRPVLAVRNSLVWVSVAAAAVLRPPMADWRTAHAAAAPSPSQTLPCHDPGPPRLGRMRCRSRASSALLRPGLAAAALRRCLAGRKLRP